MGGSVIPGFRSPRACRGATARPGMALDKLGPNGPRSPGMSSSCSSIVVLVRHRAFGAAQALQLLEAVALEAADLDRRETRDLGHFVDRARYLVAEAIPQRQNASLLSRKLV